MSGHTAYDALGEDPVALVEHLVEDLDALVGQPDLVGVGVHQGPADGRTVAPAVPLLDRGVQLAADVLDRLGHRRQPGLEPGEDARGHPPSLRAPARRPVIQNAARRPPKVRRVSRWTTYLPPVALLVLVIGWLTHPEGPIGVTVVAVFLVAAVLAAVHHAEVVAHRLGDPLGSLVLAVAVTVIEVALIVTLMVGGGEGHLHPGPGHRVRRGDAEPQRHRRSLAAGRRSQAPPRGVQPGGHRVGPRDRDHAGQA